MAILARYDFRKIVKIIHMITLRKQHRRYEEYSSSKVKWLNEVPNEWKFRRAKFIFRQMRRLPRENDDVITAFRDGVVTARKNRREEGFTFAVQEIGYQGIRKGDLVIHGMDAFAGAIGVSDSDGKATPVYSVCCPKIRVSSKFYVYVLRHMSKNNFLFSLAKGIRERSTDFRYKEFSELELPIFSQEKQDTIASYLDEKCALIDFIIAKKQRQIELLKEKRAAIINRAVTRGLNDGVEMKEGKTEWKEAMPKHWQASKLKFLSTLPFQYGANESALEDDIAQPRFVRITDIDDSGQLRNDTFRSLNFSVSKDFLLDEGDILFARSGATVGKTFRYKSDWGRCCYAGYLVRMKVDKRKALSEYVYYFTKSALYEGWKNSIFIQATIQNISAEKYKNLCMPLPPLSEQKDIVQHIQKEERKTGMIIEGIERSISLLTEYKTSIISHAVTGRIKV